MPIQSLRIESIRNLNSLSFSPSRSVNIFTGANGSGKTSLLEAIHFLALTRSFRTNKFHYLVTREQRQATVFAKLHGDSGEADRPLGVQRDLEGNNQIRYSGRDIDLSELAGLLPLQVINTDTFQLLEGSPGVRRQFVDWGAFYADGAFVQLWRGFKRVLQQRNSLVKCGRIQPALRRAWDAEYVRYAEQLTEARARYVELLKPDFQAVLGKLMGDVDITLNFSPGWDQQRGLDEILEQNLQRDLRQGYTGAGPQRADLKVKAGGISAAESLSRGQKKLVVSALKLAQGALFHRLTQRACVYLIDDLPSELDERHSRLFCEFLAASDNQCFITCVDPAALGDCWGERQDVSYFQLDEGKLVAAPEGASQ